MKQGEVWAGRRKGCGRGAGASRMQGRADWRFAARARTPNMLAMLVTLDVSRLSGWLNFSAPCRVARTAHEAGRGVDQQAKGLWARCAGASRMQGRLGWRFGARARTLNMPPMSVTLDVSKLSGWLNFSAACRVARTAHEAGRGVDRKAEG